MTMRGENAMHLPLFSVGKGTGKRMRGSPAGDAAVGRITMGKTKNKDGPESHTASCSP